MQQSTEKLAQSNNKNIPHFLGQIYGKDHI